MDVAAIQERLLGFVTSELLNDRDDLVLGPEDDLLSTELVDSLGVMRIVVFIEDTFGVKVMPADVTIENFISISTISVYVAGLRG